MPLLKGYARLCELYFEHLLDLLNKSILVQQFPPRMSKSKTPLQQAIDRKSKAKGLSKIWWFFEVFRLRLTESQEALFKMQNELNDDKTLSRIEKEMNESK